MDKFWKFVANIVGLVALILLACWMISAIH